MDSVKWQKIKDVLSNLLNLPENDRPLFLAKVENEEIRLEVEKLLSIHQQAENFIDRPLLIEQGVVENEPNDNLIGKQIENYLILERIGTGGMGTVYLAERLNSDFTQKVALKIIKRGMDSEAILKRFARERKILATLKHRNIAQLLDGGISSEGLPFFVLEFIEGKPLNQFCCENELSLEKVLEIFQQICGAVDFAHKNLIVHRDLKPSNVLVNENGTPKLLDFGIAKLLSDEDAEATFTQAKIFTLEYASPEQILGKNVTTATDVYSLGVILYELLSGHRPFETKGKTYDEIVKSVCETPPTKPSDAITKYKEVVTQNENPKSKIHNPKSLEGDLDNIILKALQKEPAERYHSVQQFSEDISRFLNGLPVLARPQTFKYRFGKYVKRHAVGVFAAALVLLSLVSGISVATWQAVVARRERAKAEQRFNDVRKLANTVLFEYHDSIEKLAGSTPIREKMVKDSLEYLDKLSIESGGDADLQREIATAYQKVGDVQGNPYLANLGNPDAAAESYRKSRTIREALLNDDPNNLQNLFDLAVTNEKIGDILWAKGENDDSLSSYQNASIVYEQLSTFGKLSDVYSPARILYRIGQVQEQGGNLPNALETYSKALTESEKAKLIEPANVLVQRSVATGYGKIGDIYYQLKDYPKATENYQKAFPIIQEVSKNDPTNTNLRRATVLILARLALVKQQAGDLHRSIEYNDQAIKTLKEIIISDSNNLQVRFDLADIQANVGETYGLLNDFAHSEEKFQEAFSTYKESLAKNPNYTVSRINFGNTYIMYGKILLKAEKAANALENFREALKILSDDSIKNESTEKFAEIYEGIADSLFLLKSKAENLRKAKEMYQKSSDIWQNLSDKGKLPKADDENISKIQKKIDRCNSLIR